MPHELITDEYLAIRLKNGDGRAASMIYERYKTGLFTFCRRLLGDTEGAEDAVHETIVKMMTLHGSLRNPGSLKSWLFTIARNEAFSALQKRQRVRPLSDEDENIFSEDETATEIQRNEQSSIINNLLNRMLPQYKEVLLLREYETLSYEEIADVTGTSVSAVKSRLFKARKALLETMEPYRKAGSL
ncbi:MAG: RNA polymerase sigma factor [Bacteroidota bacterium]